MDKTKINRLILLGNGFDLAHGLKTGYNDFIVWYLENCLSEAQQNMRYSDPIFDVFVRNVNTIKDLWKYKLDNVKSFVEYFYNKGFRTIIKQNSFKIEGVQNDWENPFDINVKSRFIENLIMNCSFDNWVDIENVYYEELKFILSRSPNIDRMVEVRDLNNALSYLIEQLEKYLQSIKIIHKIDEYDDIFNSPYESKEFVDDVLSPRLNMTIESTLIVNFNYTSTVELYIDHQSISELYFDINYIHGKLRDKNNTLIFGFGDELDSEYLNFELDKTKGIFDYIKSFWYFKTSNYYNLIRFIESNDFQVYILGHSCGLSDRTMLNMIFEHDNCKSIKIFYHQNGVRNNYTELTHEISRHFKNKQKMRRRIVSFDKSSPMPQVDIK